MAQQTEQEVVLNLKKEMENEARRQSQKFKENIFKQEKKEDPLKPSQAGNIFENREKKESMNLFASNKGSVNLFQVQNNSNSNVPLLGAKCIFNVMAKPAIANEEKSEDEDQKGCQNEQLQSHQSSFKTEPVNKVMKFEYKNQSEKIKEVTLKKFKSGGNPAKEEIYMTLEKMPNQKNTLYLIVRNNTTKVIVFKGVVMKDISKIDNFMGKKDNLRIEVLKKTQIEEEQEKVTKQIVKMQFITEEECKDFEEAIQSSFREQ